MVLTGSSDHRDSHLQFLTEGDQRTCCAGRAASQVVVTVAVLGHAGWHARCCQQQVLGFSSAEKLWRSRSCRSAQFVDLPVVVQRPIPMVFLLGRPWRLRSCSIFLVVDAPVVQVVFHARVGRFRPLVLGQGDMPVVQRQAAWFDTGYMCCLSTWPFHRCSSWDKVVVPVVCTTNAWSNCSSQWGAAVAVPLQGR